MPVCEGLQEEESSLAGGRPSEAFEDGLLPVRRVSKAFEGMTVMTSRLSDATGRLLADADVSLSLMQPLEQQVYRE